MEQSARKTSFTDTALGEFPLDRAVRTASLAAVLLLAACLIVLGFFAPPHSAALALSVSGGAASPALSLSESLSADVPSAPLSAAQQLSFSTPASPRAESQATEVTP